MLPFESETPSGVAAAPTPLTTFCVQVRPSWPVSFVIAVPMGKVSVEPTEPR